MANLNQTGPVPPLQHTTFSSFYQDTTLDPCQGQYTQIMNRFDPEVNNNITHMYLLEQAVGYGPVPGAIWSVLSLCSVTDSDSCLLCTLTFKVHWRP